MIFTFGLIGESYGNIRSSGFSATEEEFNSYYNNGGKHALFFIKDCENRDLKTEKFIDVIGNKVVYNTFNGQQDLLNKIEKALAGYINETHAGSYHNNYSFSSSDLSRYKKYKRRT